MFMERSLFVDDELYGDEPHEPTALNWPPPMALPELPELRGPIEVLPAAAPALQEEPTRQTRLLARAARATRGPILVIGTAVTVALSGGYAAGHAFGWKMPPKFRASMRASVPPALTTFVNEQIPALVARPGTPLWCPAEEPAAPSEAREDLPPAHALESPEASAAAGALRQPALFELAGSRPAISVVPRLRRPFQEQERPAPPWRGVVWSPRENRLVSVSTSGRAPAAVAAGTRLAGPMPSPLLH